MIRLMTNKLIASMRESLFDKDDDGFLYDKIRKTIIPDTKGIKNYRFFDNTLSI